MTCVVTHDDDEAPALAHMYCQDIVVFNNESEASKLQSSFEELLEYENKSGGVGGDSTGFWNFDVLSFNHLMNLTICNVKLKDIKFLRCCTLLKSLNISFNKIRDISPLGALTQLVHLDMSHNKIIDISPLKDLAQLQILRFHKNYIQCIEALNSLENICELWMSNNEIPWTEFVHFSKLNYFAHVVIEKNTCEDKPKYLEFLLAICPSILTINGQPAINYMPKDTQIDNKNWYNPSDFLKTTDGRIMLTQAKALLNESQREFLGTQVIGNVGVRRNLLVNSTMMSPTRRASLDSCGVTTLAHDFSGSTCINGSASITGSGTGMLTSGTGTLHQQFRSTRSEGGEPIKYYKAQRRTKNTPKKFVQEYDEMLHQSTGAGAGDRHREHEGGGDGQASSSVLQSSDTDTLIPPHNLNPQERETERQRSQARLLATPVTLIRFGETSSAAVAVSLHEDGTGYARWSHNGSVACSFENNRLFSQFRNGAIAVVVDPGGNGTVMNPRGKCVLNLRVTEQQQQQQQQQQHQRGNGEEGGQTGAGVGVGVGAVAEILSPDDGSVLHIFRKGASTTTDTDTNTAFSAQQQQWDFPNMNVVFDPEAWEVRVSVTNSRAVTCFSSRKGGQLVSEVSSKDKNNTTSSGRGGGGGKKSSGSSGVGGAVMSTDGHENMRSGLASVMSTLDDMLEGMKKK